MQIAEVNLMKPIAGKNTLFFVGKNPPDGKHFKPESVKPAIWFLLYSGEGFTGDRVYGSHCRTPLNNIYLLYKWL